MNFGLTSLPRPPKHFRIEFNNEHNNFTVYNYVICLKMSSVSRVFKKNAYVVIGHQRSYEFLSIILEYDTVQKGNFRIPAVFSEKKFVEKGPFLNNIHHILVRSKDQIQIIDDTNQKISQNFSGQISPSLIHITNIKADPTLMTRTSTWIHLPNGNKKEYNIKFKNTPQAGYMFNKDGYQVKHIHLIVKNKYDYSAISGWWLNEKIGSFYLNSDGSMDDVELILDSPILFVSEESIECWQDAKCYTFVRSSNYCSVM
jgi:hypothetical protein